MEHVVDAIQAAIQKHDPVELRETLDLMPLHTFPHTQRLAILVASLEACRPIPEEFQADLAETLLKHWSNHDQQAEGTLVDLAADVSVPAETLHWVCRAVAMTTPLDVAVIALIEAGTSSNVGTLDASIALPRLERAYGPSAQEIISMDQWEHLIREAEMQGNEKVADLLRAKVQAPVPRWMRGDLHLDSIPAQPDQRDLPDLAALMANQLTELASLQSTQQDIEVDPEAGTDFCQAFVATATQVELARITPKEGATIPTSQQDTCWIRQYGPANAIPNQNCCGAPQQQGPCRMLYCTCRRWEEDTEEVLESTDWFEGSCQHCQRSIRKYRHAFRFPLAQGGWLGCYCSPECARQNPPYPLTSLSKAVMDRVLGQLREYGISEV